MMNFLPIYSLPVYSAYCLFTCLQCLHVCMLTLQHSLSLDIPCGLLYDNPFTGMTSVVRVFPIQDLFTMQSYGKPRLLQVSVANSLLTYRLPGNPSTFFIQKWVFQKLCTSIPCLWAYGHRFCLHRKRHKATTSHR